MGQWPSLLLHGLAPTRHQSVLASLPRELQGGPRGHGWEPSAGSSLHLPPTPPPPHPAPGAQGRLLSLGNGSPGPAVAELSHPQSQSPRMQGGTRGLVSAPQGSGGAARQGSGCQPEMDSWHFC